MHIFDVLGPVMIGPSSSHTAGAVKIGYVTRKLLGETPQRIHLGAGFLKPSCVGEFGHARYSVFEVRAAFALIN